MINSAVVKSYFSSPSSLTSPVSHARLTDALITKLDHLWRLFSTQPQQQADVRFYQLELITSFVQCTLCADENLPFLTSRPSDTQQLQSVQYDAVTLVIFSFHRSVMWEWTRNTCSKLLCLAGCEDEIQTTVKQYDFFFTPGKLHLMACFSTVTTVLFKINKSTHKFQALKTEIWGVSLMCCSRCKMRNWLCIKQSSVYIIVALTVHLNCQEKKTPGSRCQKVKRIFYLW